MLAQGMTLADVGCAPTRVPPRASPPSPSAVAAPAAAAPPAVATPRVAAPPTREEVARGCLEGPEVPAVLALAPIEGASSGSATWFDVSRSDGRRLVVRVGPAAEGEADGCTAYSPDDARQVRGRFARGAGSQTLTLMPAPGDHEGVAALALRDESGAAAAPFTEVDGACTDGHTRLSALRVAPDQDVALLACCSSSGAAYRLSLALYVAHEGALRQVMVVPGGFYEYPSDEERREGARPLVPPGRVTLTRRGGAIEVVRVTDQPSTREAVGERRSYTWNAAALAFEPTGAPVAVRFRAER